MTVTNPDARREEQRRAKGWSSGCSSVWAVASGPHSVRWLFASRYIFPQ